MTFQEKVLRQTCKIPKGKVSTYKDIAHSLRTRAYRAVGTALKCNEHPIKIPCHRVINSDGSIGGYAGKPSSTKKIDLLKAEGIPIKGGRIQDFEKYVYRFK